jgi:hypothetical protein
MIDVSAGVAGFYGYVLSALAEFLKTTGFKLLVCSQPEGIL